MSTELERDVEVPALTAVPAQGHGTLAEARELITSPAVQVVCTDVFDTLVWRRVAEPVEAFEVLGRRLIERGGLHPSLDPWAFATLRRKAEERVRARFLERHGQTEIRIGEIYDAIPEWVFGAVGRHGALQLEIDVERDLVVPDLDVVELLRAAHEHGKVVAAVSDFYLSGDQLRQLLGQPGLSSIPFRYVFTSSDHRENKSGALWDIVLAQCGVPGERVIHLGDNEHADVAAPQERGIRTVYLQRRSPKLHELLVAEAAFRGPAAPLAASRDKLERLEGWDVGLAALRAKMEHRRELELAPSALQPFWRYGAQVLGPVLTGFAEWVHERTRAAGADAALCLMREGGFLAELVRAAGPTVRDPVDARPFWANRDVCTRAAIGSGTRDELEPFFFRRTPPTYGEVLRSLGVAPPEVPSLATHEDTPADDPILRAMALDALTEEGPVQAGIVARSRALRERLVRYVERECGREGPIVLVDLGWGATIQMRLRQALRQAGIDRPVVGLYLLTHEGASTAVQEGCEVHGFLANLGAPAPVASTIMRSPEVLEQSLMPAHGTQLDIGEDLEPVLAAGGPQTLQQVEAEAVRRGVLAFQREYARYHLQTPGKLTRLGDARDAVAPLAMRSVAAPTAEEAALFGAWVHDENQGSTKSAALVEDHWQEKVRHLAPEQLAELPMSDIYWPHALARVHDPHLAEIAAAAQAGLIDWKATSTALESGPLTIEPVEGVGIEGSPRHHAVPRRNRHGLSLASTTLKAGSLARLQIRLGESPLVARIDWIELRLWTQGASEPQVVRIDDAAGFAQLDLVNLLALSPNVLVATTAQPIIGFATARVTPRVVFRVDVELAFAAIPIGPLLPGPGSAEAMASAEQVVRQMESSMSWRVTKPLRVAKRKLR